MTDCGLDINVVREVLKGIYTVGALEADKHNSYKLAAPLKNKIKDLPEPE